MNTSQPDIVVISPDGEYLMIVEVKLTDSRIHVQEAIDQLKRLMTSMACSLGLVVAKERIILLRDSLELSNGESIIVVGEARLPNSLLPPVDEQWNKELTLESQVQRWLEKLKMSMSISDLPSDLRILLSEQIMGLLRFGEVRAAGSRWSKAAR
jgi:hypothetical protein